MHRASPAVPGEGTEGLGTALPLGHAHPWAGWQQTLPLPQHLRQKLKMPVTENIGFPNFSFTFSFCLINYNKVFTVLITEAVPLPFFCSGSVLGGYAKVSPVPFLTLCVSFGHIGVFILMFIKMLLSLPV